MTTRILPSAPAFAARLDLRFVRACLALVCLASACTPRQGDDSEPVGQSEQVATREPPPPAPSAPGDAFAASLLGSHVRARPEDANIALSPTSLALALRLVSEGATGATRDSLATMLGFADARPSQMRDDSRALLAKLRGQADVTLDIGTALWASEETPLAPAFLANAKRSYDAEAASLDLASAQAVERVNAWASRATHGRIPTLLKEPLSKDVGLLLTNAVYFKGKWAEPFESSATRPRPFTRGDGGADTVPMMRRHDRFAYHEADGVRAARLPYSGQRFAMYVLLPDSAHDVGDAVRALTPAFLRAAAAGPWRDLALELPRFTLRYSTPLIPTLEAMGAGIAFDGRADFSRLFAVAPPESRIADVRQVVFVEVNEEGTEAAAVTSLEVVPTSVPPPPLPFVVDRPFVFAIRDDLTGELLFVGRVMDPSVRASSSDGRSGEPR